MKGPAAGGVMAIFVNPQDRDWPTFGKVCSCTLRSCAGLQVCMQPGVYCTS